MDSNLIIIANANAYLKDIDKRLREMESWGESWKRSTFYFDLINQRTNWVRWKTEALRAIRDNAI
jgi:hypothetical protein